jgi:hypothetical protein
MKTLDYRPLEEIVSDGLWTGAVATVATTAAAAACGAIENHHVAAPINAVSHIAWGDRAARHSTPSLKYTVPGLILNSAAVTSWAILQEVLFRRRQKQKDVAEALAEGAIVSGLAYVTDYYVVPARLTPGFEKRLSNRSLASIYGVLALSLGLGTLLRKNLKP